MAMAVANRYARALADAVAREGDYRGVLEELTNFVAAYGESSELREVFDSPAVPLPVKTNLLEAVLARITVSAMTRNVLRILLANYRMGQTAEVAEAFRRIANTRMGIVRVKIDSAAGLSDAERAALRARFEELTRKQVELEFHLEPALLGGIRAQIESTVYDGSIRGDLDRIRQRLMAG